MKQKFSGAGPFPSSSTTVQVGVFSIPSFEEGAHALQRNRHAALEQGAAGEVRHLVTYRFPDRFKNSLDILINNPILEPNDFDSLPFQERRPFCFIFDAKFPKVPRPIQLDSDVAFNAKEVDDIATYAVLPAELLPQDLACPEILPKKRFCRSGIISQLLATPFQR